MTVNARSRKSVFYEIVVADVVIASVIVVVVAVAVIVVVVAAVTVADVFNATTLEFLLDLETIVSRPKVAIKPD